MCGIIAVVRRPATRPVPTVDTVGAELRAALDAWAGLRRSATDAPGLMAAAEAAAGHLEAVDAMLRGVPGVTRLLESRALGVAIDHDLGELETGLAALEADLDRDGSRFDTAQLESVNAVLVRLKDVVWAVRRDRVRAARAIDDLAAGHVGPAAVEALHSVQVCLAGLDRLEVRGRDSAGVHVLVRGHGLDLGSPSVQALLADRATDRSFGSMAVRTPAGHLSFVYKAAAEIGELGDNVRSLRAAIRGDELLHLALSSPGARATVLGHTRWASVGIISQANAHPLNHEEEGDTEGPYTVAVLNGDVDNHADLRAAEGLRIAEEITTDAKVIPALLSRRLAAGEALHEAFRRTMAALEGSVAVAAGAADHPDTLLLGLRGSGQALYVGLAEDAFVVASEPYGLVEETRHYLRLDGETPSNPDDPVNSRGQIVVLDGDRAGGIDGIERRSYDGTILPVTPDEVATAQITTRDIDRGDFPHFLLKEIHDAPGSMRKTLRGRVTDGDGLLTVTVGPETIPPALAERLANRAIRQVVVIGQGTAAVAGQAVARLVEDAVAGAGIDVEALPATELSGFGLRSDMGDTIVVAISQSGTTTDTNRTVDLARDRGAWVIAIVNRRNSDLTDKADGVLYTSDGRDVEMSVPSTKAFYAQVGAGVVLAAALAQAAGDPDPQRTDRVLRAVRDLPDAMERVLALRPVIAEAAQRHAPHRRYWAVVGNGRNRVAAEEVRIKLSELAYKSIACDVTEDKKHIDLSAEPMILVCAAGLTGSNADDVAKEVAIYRAHKAAPIVIATEGESRFGAALDAFFVPAVDPDLAFVLSAMGGHLFGYEAALAIDALALPLRESRATVEALVSAGDPVDLLDRLRHGLDAPARAFFAGLQTGAYDGSLEASTAVRLATVLRYATGVVPLDHYQVELGKVGTPSVLIDDLVDVLSQAIDELTRPIDAIKHQAKTVTVGISRADESLLAAALVREVLEAGAPRDLLTYRALRTLAALDPAVAEVTGYTRYRIDGDVAAGTATAHVLDQGGVARQLRSRTADDPTLRGIKRRAALEREVTVAVGRSDGRTLIVVPEVKDDEATGLTLLHVRFHDRLPAPVMRGVLQGYRGRFAAIQDAVTETEPTFREDLLGEQPVIELLTVPVHTMAERWREAGR